MSALERLFLESNGKPIFRNGQKIQLVDEIKIGPKATMTIKFLSSNSNWRQGISLVTDGTFRVNNMSVKKALVIWKDTAPTVVELKITSRDCTIKIHNVWDIGDGVVHAWHNGAGMIVKHGESEIEYNCNDGFDDEDFDELKFSVSISSSETESRQRQ